MDPSLHELLLRLQSVNLTLRKRLELAQAIVPELNLHIARLLTIEAVPAAALLGDVVRQSPYAQGLGPVDSAQVFLATIRIPGGIGVLLIDSEEYLAARKLPEGLESEAATKFLMFADCPPAIQALLLPQVTSLLTRLCRLLDDMR